MQKKCKFIKALAGFVIAGVFMNASVCGATPTAELSDNVISVNYTYEDTGFGTMMYVLNDRVTDEDVLSEEYLREHLVWVSTVSGGTAECVIPEGSPYGAYTVIIGADGLSNVKSSRLAYVLYEEPGIRAQAASEIKNAKNADDMAEKFLEYNNRAFMIDEALLNANKDFVFELVCELDSDASLEDMAGCVLAAESFGSMKTMSKDKIAEFLVENYEALGLDGDIALYSDEVAEFVADSIESCDSIGEIKALTNDSLAIVALNNAASSKFFEVLDKYNSIFGVTLSDKLEDLNRYEIEKLLADIDFSDVNTVETQVNTAINNLYEKYNSNTNSGSGGGSGGGSGRGSGGGASSAPISLTKPTVDEINDNVIEKVSLTDLDGYDWAKDEINSLFAKGCINGDGNGKFRPGDGILREEFIKILITVFNDGKIVEKKLKFVDVSDEWYKPYIETAVALDIVKGVSEDTFGVGQYLTREDAAVLIKRAADATYRDLVKKQTLVSFTDQESISDYARVSVDILARAQVFNGFEDGSFRPKNNITRAEIAKVVYSFTEQ